MKTSQNTISTTAILIACASALILLNGCIPQYYWVKPGATDSEWEFDQAECRVHAAGEAPSNPQQVPISSGYYEPAYTNCSGYGGAINCVTTGGSYVPPSYYTYDANRSVRKDALYVCLTRKGWQRVTEEEWKSMSPRNATSSQHDWVKMAPSSQNDGSEKFIVEVGGYCNEPNDCVRGLTCKSNKCVKR